MRVLLVEDEPMNVLLFRDVLEADGHAPGGQPGGDLHEDPERARHRDDREEVAHVGPAVALPVEAVVEQERLSVLGQVASGMAHDINNALTPVVGFSEFLLQMQTDLPASTQNPLHHILRGGKQIAAIVDRVRQFYRVRSQEEPFTLVDLNSMVAKVVQANNPMTIQPKMLTDQPYGRAEPVTGGSAGDSAGVAIPPPACAGAGGPPPASAGVGGWPPDSAGIARLNAHCPPLCPMRTRIVFAPATRWARKRSSPSRQARSP